MSRHKPGSRIEQMWETFQSKGVEAAMALGPSLNLAPSTVNNWLRGWAKEAGAEPPKVSKATQAKPTKEQVPKEKAPTRATKEEAAALRAAKADAKATEKRSNVTVVWTERPVRLLHRGEQCSEIKWLDTGSTQALPNDQIKFKKEL